MEALPADRLSTLPADLLCKIASHLHLQEVILYLLPVCSSLHRSLLSTSWVRSLFCHPRLFFLCPPHLLQHLVSLRLHQEGFACLDPLRVLSRPIFFRIGVRPPTLFSELEKLGVSFADLPIPASLQELDLSQCHITNEQLLDVVLPPGVRLTKLNLSANPCGQTLPRLAWSFSDSLHILQLDSISLFDAVREIHWPAHLTHLSLASNLGIGFYLHYVDFPPSLRYLNLNYNRIGAHIGQLRLPNGLTTLMLTGNQLERHISKLVLPQSLEHLSVGDNGLSKYLLQLRLPHCLRSLNLFSNLLSVQVVVFFRQCGLPWLETLELTGNKIGKRDVQELLRLLPRGCQITMQERVFAAT